MSELYNRLMDDNPTYYGEAQYFEPMNDVALNDDWAIPSLVSGGAGLFKSVPYLPYLKDIWKKKGLVSMR